MGNPGLMAPRYQSEDAARERFEKARWPNGPGCPHCGARIGLRKLLILQKWTPQICQSKKVSVCEHLRARQSHLETARRVSQPIGRWPASGTSKIRTWKVVPKADCRKVERFGITT